MNRDSHSLSAKRRPFLYRTAGLALVLALSIVGIARVEADPLIKPLPPESAYDPTPRHEFLLHHFTIDVLTFVLMHETGHMAFHEFNWPVWSRTTEESQADDFAAAVLTSKVDPGAGDQHNALASVALFWHAVHVQQLEAPGAYDWADEHGDPEQRAYKIACLLYGANPGAFAGIAKMFEVQVKRDFCVDSSQRIRTDLDRIITPNLNPNRSSPLDPWTPHVAVVYRDIDKGLPNDLRASLSRYRQIVQSLGILDIAGRYLVRLKKTDRDVALEQVQKALNKRPSGTPTDPRHADMNPVVHPSLDHPAEGAPLDAYNYSVIGDSCSNDQKNDVIMNAWWNPRQRSITLCYALVYQVETLGKRLLATPR